MSEHDQIGRTENQLCPERGGGRLTRFAGDLVELFRHREHGKTARTLSICMCVLGAIAAISAAKTMQYYFFARQGSFKRSSLRRTATQQRNSIGHSRQSRHLRV